MRLISYWWLPIISGIFWLVTLLTLLLWWIVHDHSRHYPSMSRRQTIAYISDVGAQDLKPLFIAGVSVTAVFLDLSFAANRWLRHRGRLLPNTTTFEKVLTGLSIFFAIVGTVGIICLAIFDTLRHSSLHRLFLLLFIAGYLLSAIFICWEYQRLGAQYREHRYLAISFWVKLVFIIVELVLAIAFAVCMATSRSNVAAILEWIIALIFTFYVFSFVFDLWPAVHTKDPEKRFVKPGLHRPAANGTGTGTATESGSGSEGSVSAGGHEMDEQGLAVRPGAPHSSLPPPGQEYPRFMERGPAPTSAANF